MQIKKGMFLKYKYSPDVIVQVVKVLWVEEGDVKFIGRVDGYETEFEISREQRDSWSEV